MQIKGAIKFLAVAFALVCLFHLIFTFVTNSVESDAQDFAENSNLTEQAKDLSQGNPVREKIIYDSLYSVQVRHYLDSMSSEIVYNFLWIRKYTYAECKQKEINLGLDLRGGMNVTLEISIPDIIMALSGNSKDPAFLKAIDLAKEKQKSSDQDYITLFENSWNEVNPNGKLSAIFNIELKDRINFNSTNEEVLKVIRDECEDAIDRTFNILRSRIDRFGVTQPNIQKLATTGRILIELPGVKEPERVRKLLQGTARLEFWETYEYSDAFSYMDQADKKLKSILYAEDTIIAGDSTELAEQTDTTEVDTSKQASLIDEVASDSGAADKQGAQSIEDRAKENPLHTYLQPAFVQDESGNMFPNRGPVVGYCRVIDTAKVGAMLRIPAVRSIFPRDMRLMWTVKPDDEDKSILKLIALRASRDGTASLNGDVITDARQDFGQNNSNEITMAMNSEGAQIWKNLTASNIGHSIAIVLDNYVYSFPTVQNEIPNGRSSITGNFTLEEAKDLANILKAGKLPAPARIVEEAVVGPSLGREAISAGLLSFVIAFILVLLYMQLYYNRAGLVANVALLLNVFFLFGSLASLSAVLTLPGIAGIVLSLGMAVDANVIIYERVREEIRAGKGMRLALSDGYKHAYSAIIDSNVTTIMTGVVLYIFGSGPVQGFATTLIIGLLISLFTAIFISRLIFEYMLNRNWNITYWNKITKDLFTNTKINFIGLRKKLYIVSLIIIFGGLLSIFTRGFSFGVDFAGGRTYVIRFDKDVSTLDVRKSLRETFGEDMEVKTFGADNQVKITTKYLVDDNNPEVDSIIETKLFEGLKGFYSTSITYDDFVVAKDGKEIGKLSSQKVGPTIADDIRIAAVWAVVIALVLIFLYVAIRFRRWQWGLGSVASLIHDSVIALSLYSWFHGVVPWSMEIDQSTIAVLLTVIGFSVNDTVIIFDRIREYRNLYPKRDLSVNINDAVNHTLGRTVNTTGTVLIVLLAMMLFGGEIIRGMNFALFIGMAVGTYSSVFNATPIAYDLIMFMERKKNKSPKK